MSDTVYKLDSQEKKQFLVSLFYDFNRVQGNATAKEFPLEKLLNAASVMSKLVSKEEKVEGGVRREFDDTEVTLTLSEVAFLKDLFDQKKNFTIDESRMALFFKEYFNQNV